VNWRQDLFSINTEANYLRNQLFSDSTEFDRSYVQVMPRVNLSTVPYSIIQSDIPFFQHVAIGADASFTRFRQVKEDESQYLRNAQ
jgi:LPS-assembly protein